MEKKKKRYLKDSLITLAVLVACFSVSLLLHNLLELNESISAIFIFGVFIISLNTDGYLFGVLSAFVSVFAVNFAFAFPYFSFNFEIKENLFSAIFMIIIALMTGALTTKLKIWQEIKADAELERMRANLLRAVSHDLRTPLTTIYGSSSAILESGENLSEEQKSKMVNGIKEDSQWLIRIVENLLSVTRIDGKKVELIKTPTVLFELIDSVLIKFKKRYPSAQVEIDIPEDVVLIPMDPMLIEQVLVNILENAVQHAVGMTKIQLSVKTEDGKAVFRVRDDGCGIEKEALKKIFDGYFSLDNPTFDSGKRNAGIGLSVCSTILSAHGGQITADNYVDGGAIFTFSLEVMEDLSYERRD